MKARRSFTAWLRTVRAAIRRVRAPLMLLGAVTATGTLLFWLGGHMPGPVHAFVYTINLVTLQTAPDALPAQEGMQLAALGLMAGGVIALTGGAANLIDYMRDPKQQQMALASTLSNHVIVCGVGRVGYRVISELLELGDAVVAINRTENEEWLDALKRAGVPVIIGDARQSATLKEAGVERASSLIACTSDDLTNLDVALDARAIHPKIKIVLRMFDQQLAERVSRGFDIKTAFSVSALAAPALAAAATRTRVDYSFKLNGNLLNVVTISFKSESAFAGKTIRQVEEMSNCSVIGMDQNGAMVMHPPHEHVVRAGERYHVVGPLAGVRMLQQ